MNPKNFNGPSMSFVRTTQMRSLRLRSLAPGLALALFVFSSAPSYADDTEIFMVQPATNTQPNILLVLDTSGSMNETADESPLPYDPTKSYDNSAPTATTRRFTIIRARARRAELRRDVTRQA